MQILRMGFSREPGRTKQLSGVPVALTVPLIDNHCLPILISLIQEQTVAILQGHQDGSF